GSPGGGTAADVSDRPPSAGAGSFRPKAKWIAWGLGAAALGVGIYGFVRQSGAGSDFDSGCGIDRTGAVVPAPGSTRTAADCTGLKNRVDSGFGVEVIGLASAAVLAAAG